MRVVHLVPALFGSRGIVGGAERYVCELARHMADVVPTTLVSFGTLDGEESVGALRIRVIGSPWLVRGQRANPFSARMFGELLRADVVHCHQQHVLMSSAAAAWCRLTRRPVFVSDLGGGGWDVSAYVSTDRWFDGHLHLSDYSRTVYGHGQDERARVIGGGVDTGRFSPDATVAKQGGALFVGRLLPHKGVTDLVEALPSGMKLTVVGPEPDADMKLRLMRLALGKAVTLRHGLDDAGLIQEYRRAFCIVLPSVYEMADGRRTIVPELLGQTLLEGMACGLPAVCTRVASLPEVVEDGVTGFVVPPNDPGALRGRLEWLQSHPQEAAAMGEAGRRRVTDRFTWPAVVRRCLDAYQSMGRAASLTSGLLVSHAAR